MHLGMICALSCGWFVVDRLLRRRMHAGTELRNCGRRMRIKANAGLQLFERRRWIPTDAGKLVAAYAAEMEDHSVGLFRRLQDAIAACTAACNHSATAESPRYWLRLINFAKHTQTSFLTFGGQQMNYWI
jgi:hypothetical protein